MDKRALVPSVILAVSIMVLFSAAAFSNDWFIDYNASELHPQMYVPPDGVTYEEPPWFYDPVTKEPLPEPDREADPLLWEQWRTWKTWDDWTHSINYQMFEEFGPILLVLALLMFGSIIGGVYIAKEDDAEEEGDE